MRQVILRRLLDVGFRSIGDIRPRYLRGWFMHVHGHSCTIRSEPFLGDRIYGRIHGQCVIEMYGIRSKTAYFGPKHRIHDRIYTVCRMTESVWCNYVHR